MMNILLQVHGLLLTTVALNSWAGIPNNHVLAEEQRVIDGGRDVLISVGQDEIKANLNRSNVVFTREDQAFIGALGAIGMANARLQRSTTEQKKMEPLREALIGFEFDALAEQQTTATLSAIDWLSPLVFSFTKKSSSTSKSLMLGSANSSQMIIVDYEYGMSEHFKAIELNCRVSIAERDKGESLEPAVRMSPSNMLYTQLHKVVIPLNRASTNPTENIKRWSEGDAMRAKAALDTSLRMVQQMIRRGLTLTKHDQRIFLGAKFVDEDHYRGRLIEQADGDTMMWIVEPNDMWVMVTRSIQ